MKRGAVVAGLVIVCVGAYLVWDTYEDRQAVYRQMSRWEWTFLPAETKLRTYARLYELNVFLSVSGAILLVGAVVSIAGAFLGRTQKSDLKSFPSKSSEASSIIKVRCLKWDGLNHETAIFCVHCGARLKSESA